MKHEHHTQHSGHGAEHYWQLLAMAILHIPLMYIIMFAMVHQGSDLYNNWNMLYMAGMMVAPMVFLMPLTMRKMYQDRKKNVIVYAGSIVLLAALYLFTREQTLIEDKQFVRSMIPHHSGAILMCEKSTLVDTELKSLCDKIMSGQREEIEQMKKILERL